MGEPLTAGPLPVALDVALRAVVLDAVACGGEIAVVVRHLQRGDCWELNAAVPFPSASTIKVPVLAALYAAAAEGHARLDQDVVLRAEDQVTGSGILQVLSPGVRLPLRDLAELMIVVSDNTATNMILEVVGIDRVNRLLDRLGLTTTRLVRALQVIPADHQGMNTITAGEYAALFAGLATGRVVSWEASRRMVATLKRQQINDALPALLPPAGGGDVALGAFPAWEWAHKTGGLTGVQHDGGLFYVPGHTVVVTVLTRGCGPGHVARQLIARVGRAVWEAYGDAASA